MNYIKFYQNKYDSQGWKIIHKRSVRYRQKDIWQDFEVIKIYREYWKF